MFPAVWLVLRPSGIVLNIAKEKHTLCHSVFAFKEVFLHVHVGLQTNTGNDGGRTKTVGQQTDDGRSSSSGEDLFLCVSLQFLSAWLLACFEMTATWTFVSWGFLSTFYFREDSFGHWPRRLWVQKTWEDGVWWCTSFQKASSWRLREVYDAAKEPKKTRICCVVWGFWWSAFGKV